MYSTVTRLTDAQWKATPSAVVQILAAPGANRMILFQRATLVLNTTAGAYTNVANAAACHFILGTGNESSNFLLSDFLFESAGVVVCSFTPQAYQNPSNAALYEFYLLGAACIDKALNFEMLNGANGNFTGGNTANTAIIAVEYSIVQTV